MKALIKRAAQDRDTADLLCCALFAVCSVAGGVFVYLTRICTVLAAW